MDTPGFNDTYRSDTEVLLELAKWLEITYRQNAKLTGIIYLHRIMDNRMEGSAMRNLKMFRKLCGNDPLENVVIASTFWGVLDDKKSLAHEKELCETPDFWGDMMEHGAKVTRFSDTQESALEVLRLFAKKKAITLEIQRELVDEQIPLGATAAGHAVNEELAEMEMKHNADLARFQEDLAVALAEKDVKLEQVLKKEREKTEERLDRIRNDQNLWRQARGEEIRRLETENEKRFRTMKVEYDHKLESQRLEAERLRAQDQASFKDEMTRLQVTNEAMVHFGSGGKSEKLLQFAAAGVAAVLQPAAIPLAVAALVDLINEVID